MKNYFDLKGQVAIVTGCSTGLGVQMAKALASQGCKIVAVARRQEMIDKVAEELNKEYGVETLAARCDITDTDAVNSMLDSVIEKFGRVDILINNAGTGAVAPAEDITDEQFENEMNIELSGDDMGVLIGKRGQTLDSLQYLTSLVVNKGEDDYIRVKVDTENYRKRRQDTLENLAKNIAFKVKRTKRSVSLEPMNPYERRIIHSALQNDKFVTTHSEGEEPFRHVVVTMKK